MTTADLTLDEPSAELIDRLNQDLRTASTSLTQNEVRLLVDLYYQVQEFRIATANIIRTQGEGEPNALSQWVFANFKVIEKDIVASMGLFAAYYKVGQWLQSIYGIGPVISAGLLAHLDIRKSKTPGGFLTFAGVIDPTRQPWEKGQKRPWNAKLKTLVCVRMGETLVKFSGNDKCVYGKLYAERKRRLIRENTAGNFSDHALARSKDVDKNTIAYQWYSGQYPGNDMGEDFFFLTLPQREQKMKECRLDKGKGMPMLPPAHIHRRAVRVAAQMVLSHLHYVMYEDYYSKTYEFVPYVHSGHYKEGSPGYHGEKHESIMMPSGWPNDDLDGAPLSELLDKPIV